MQITKFSKYLTSLDGTSKRLLITNIIKDLILELEATETQNAVNLILGQLFAPFKNLNFNIAEKMMMRALSLAYSATLETVAELFKQTGDLGDTAEKLSHQKSSTLSINETHQKLVEVAVIEGTGSQDKKIEKLAKLLNRLDNTSAKYVVRIVLGTTRLGFTALTVIDALSQITTGSKQDKDTIEARYNIHPDIGFITEMVKAKGLKALNNIAIEVGVPILAQKPQRVANPEEILEKMASKEVYVEYKLDGTRVQIHFDRNKRVPKTTTSLFENGDEDIFIKAYTRNLDETIHQYPDIVDGINKQLKATSVILDGEAIGFDKDTGRFLEFQQTISRKRKHGISETAVQIPLKYVVFDILYLDGKSLIELPLRERRKILQEIVKPGDTVMLSHAVITDSASVIKQTFEDAKSKNLEGLVIKNPDKGYEAGARSFAWTKLKRIEEEGYEQGAADSVDCVVMGYNTGKGVRADFGLGAFLAGIYDPITLKYKTVTKVGTGLKETDLENLKKMGDAIASKDKPESYEVDKDLIPDVWILPKIVVELRADEITISPKHTSGYALRFPRLMKFRPDKKPEDSTSLKEIGELYLLQKK